MEKADEILGAADASGLQKIKATGFQTQDPGQAQMAESACVYTILKKGK
jgi:hypothetical protein